MSSIRLSGLLLLALAGAARAQAPADHVMTLSDAYRRALSRSERVNLAGNVVSDAKERALGVWSQVGPQVSVQGYGVLETQTAFQPPGSPPIIVAPDKQFGATGQITQPIIRGGVFAARASAKDGIEAANASLSSAREQLMFEVTAAFIDVVRARQLAELARTSLKRAETQYTITSARVKAGGTLRTAELLASLDVSRSRRLVINTEGEVRNTEVAFERIVGDPAGEGMALPPTPEPPALQAAIERALARDDVRALRLRISESQRAEGTFKARLAPTLDVQAAYSYFTYLFPIGDNAHVWSVRALVNIPLFQGGDEYVQLRLQRLRTEALRLEESQLLRRVDEAVKVAAIRLDTARRAAGVAEAQAKTATQNYDLVVAQFRLGGVTFLEVTTAQAALIESENLRAIANYERELATYQLLFATGELKL